MADNKITEEELVTRIQGEIVDSLGYMGDTISKQREQAMDYYYAMPFGNEIEDGMDLTEAEDIKKRWQEYTELYKKYLHNPDNHDGVITHLEPDILEYEVKWALESITTNKASGGDGIQLSYLKS